MQRINTSKASENEKVNTIFAMDIINMAHSHMMYVTFKLFREKFEKTEPFKCPNVTANMILLAKLYGLWEILQDSAALYETGFFGYGTAPHVLEAAKKIMVLLRPQMIPLVESFGYADSQLVSAIGNSYGDIYE
jgi:hypothetical protein